MSSPVVVTITGGDQQLADGHQAVVRLAIMNLMGRGPGVRGRTREEVVTYAADILTEMWEAGELVLDVDQ